LAIIFGQSSALGHQERLNAELSADLMELEIAASNLLRDDGSESLGDQATRLVALRELLVGEISKNKESINSAKSDLEGTLVRLEEVKAALVEKEKDLEESTAKLDVISSALIDAHEVLNNKNNKLSDVRAKLREAERATAEANTNHNALENEYRSVQESIEAIEGALRQGERRLGELGELLGGRIDNYLAALRGKGWIDLSEVIAAEGRGQKEYENVLVFLYGMISEGKMQMRTHRNELQVRLQND
jgi:chromosome segregation ATPase